MGNTIQLMRHFAKAASAFLKTVTIPVQKEVTLNKELLVGLKDALSSISDQKYQEKLKRPIQITTENGTDEVYAPIGSHVRHTLDFYLNFLKGLKDAQSDFFVINYDDRDDESKVSVDLELAIHTIDNILLGLDTIENNRFGNANNESDQAFFTTTGSQLQFLASHTTHHMAIIDMTAGSLGIRFKENFGVAQSTLDRIARNRQISSLKAA